MGGCHPAQANIGPNKQTSSDNVCSPTSTRSTPTCAEPESSGLASTPPKVREVMVRSTVGPTQGYCLVVPVQVKGKSLESVVDTGAQVSIINSKLINISQFEVEPVVLRGLEPDKPINGHLIKDVSINLGGRMYRWVLYVAPIEDDFLLGLDFMIAYKIDPLVSRNILMADGLEIPALLKRGATGQRQNVGRVHVTRLTVVPPNTVMRVQCDVDMCYEGNTCLVSPGCGRKALAMPYAAVNIKGGKIVTQVTNLSDHFVTLCKGYSLGSIEEIDEVIEESSQEDTVPKVRRSAMDGSHPPAASGSTSGTGSCYSTSEILENLPYKTMNEVNSGMPEFMSEVFVNSYSELTEEQSIIFGNLLIKFWNIFAKDDTDLGGALLGLSIISTGGCKTY